MKNKFLVLVLILTLGVGLLIAGCNTASTTDSDDDDDDTSSTFTLTSTSWTDGGTIPAANRHDSISGGLNYTPQLTWSNAPAGTKSFAIKMIDAQSSSWIHWLVYNIPSAESSVAQNASTGGTVIDNSFETAVDGGTETGYGGPAPTVGSGTHTYTITIYALDETTILPVASNAGFTSVCNAASLGTATYSGVYSR